MSFKRLINKLVSLKDTETKKKIKNNYEFDAVPDFPKAESKISMTTEPDNVEINNKSPQCESEENCKPKPNSNESRRKDSSEKNPEQEESNFFPNPKGEHFSESEKTKSGGASPQLHQTSMVFNGCTQFQVGNTYSQVFVGKSSKPTQDTTVNKFEKTEAVKGLLKCKDKIETAYLETLSIHFGSKWKAIGKMLNLTDGQLDSISERYKGHQERGFQMLKTWWQKKGDQATIGELCKKLWNGNIDAAKEAVHNLSLNFDDLN